MYSVLHMETCIDSINPFLSVHNDRVEALKMQRLTIATLNNNKKGEQAIGCSSFIETRVKHIV